MNFPAVFYCAVFGYICGSIPSAYLIVRGIAKTDIRSFESGNVGSTNALRVLGPKGGALTLLGDILKTILAMALPYFLRADRHLFFATGAAAIIGHNWPVFLRFKGGKGVAVSASVMTLLQPIIGIISIALFVLTVWRTKYVSLSSMTMALCWPLLLILTHGGLDEILFASAVFLLIVVQHRGNIKRLLAGTERKTGLKKVES